MVYFVYVALANAPRSVTLSHKWASAVLSFVVSFYHDVQLLPTSV